MARTKKNPDAVEPKKTATKTTKTATKQTEPKPNIVSAEAVQKLKDLVALHPTATASVLKAFTTDADVKQLLDEFIERGGDCPIEVY